MEVITDQTIRTSVESEKNVAMTKLAHKAKIILSHVVKVTFLKIRFRIKGVDVMILLKNSHSLLQYRQDDKIQKN